MWMLVRGTLLSTRGAIIPGLESIGLSKEAVRRAWTAFKNGVWSITFLLHIWQKHVECLPEWQVHEYEGYQALGVDITAFWKPTLKNCSSKHYYPPAGKALLAVTMGIIGLTGEIHGQRLSLPRDFLRVNSQDPSESAFKAMLVKQVIKKLGKNEISVYDAGFKIKMLIKLGVERFLVRLPKNFTARRNYLPEYTGGRGGLKINDYALKRRKRNREFFDYA